MAMQSTTHEHYRKHSKVLQIIQEALCGQMHTIHDEEWEEDNYSLKYRVANKKDVELAKLNSLFNFSYSEYMDFKEGKYTRLIYGHEVVMSDTPMEVRTNEEFIIRATGSVLIGGLGLGIILLAIQDKVGITKITVVEKSPIVIKHILPKLPLGNRVNVVNADIFRYEPEEKFDTVYIDIWNHISYDNCSEMKELKAKYRKHLNRKNADHWIGCWREDDCKQRR